MKERELSILRAILQKDGASPDDLLRRFRVSKRTLYYDIRNINEQIKRFGAVKNVAESFSFIGDYDRLRRYLERDSSANFFDPRVRQNISCGSFCRGTTGRSTSCTPISASAGTPGSTTCTASGCF